MKVKTASRVSHNRRRLLYGRSLADVHHRGFQEFSRRAAPALLRMLGDRGVKDGHVLDLGCGDGTWLRALTDAGYTATGFDQSADFVRLARRAAPDARVERASVFDAVFPQSDAITALGEVFNYLPPAPLRAATLASVFRRARAALRSGGLLLFDMLVAGRPTMGYESARVGEDWAVFVRVTEDVRRARLSRQISAFVLSGTRYTREDETHILRVPTRGQVLFDLRRAGFAARASTDYAGVPLAPRRLAFLAIARNLPRGDLDPCRHRHERTGRVVRVPPPLKDSLTREHARRETQASSGGSDGQTRAKPRGRVHRKASP